MTTANLNAAVATGGKELLGFHEPDLASGADMTVQVSMVFTHSTCFSACSKFRAIINHF